MILAIFENLTSRVLVSDTSKKIMFAHRVINEDKCEFNEECSLDGTIILNPFCIKTGFRKYDFSEITQNIYDSPEKITALIKEKTAEKRSCTNFIYISGCAEKFEKFDFELIKKRSQISDEYF